MCCYYNLGFDALVSNGNILIYLIYIAFESWRTGSRVRNNLRYAYLTIRHGFCTCNLIRVKDFLDNITEITETGKNVVFTRKHILGNPFMMVSCNIPSSYGGRGSEAWVKNKS
jgi:hypothetical protein